MWCTVSAEYRSKMRLVLWTFGLIFLKAAYSFDKYLQVTNYDEVQDHVDSSVHIQEDESVTYEKPKFLELHGYKEEHFAGKIDNVVDQSELFTEKLPIRHKKHNDLRKRKHYVFYGNELNPVQERHQEKKDHVDEKSADIYDTMQNDAAPFSPVSQMKIQSLGTEEKVREKFQSAYGTLPIAIKAQDPMEKAANAHYEEMKRRIVCKSPIPKIVKVYDVYPDVLKTYVPSCTIIHQCSEDSGCCSSKTAKCGPSMTKNVTLYFTVVTKTIDKTKLTYESLSFINHTQCKCQELVDRRARGAPNFIQPSSKEIVPKSINLSFKKRCPLPCPSPFSTLFVSNGTCICECTYSNNDEVCLKYKRGEMHFNFLDNHCLFTNQCIYPSCAYGNYLTRVGRCPKQYEHRDLH